MPVSRMTLDEARRYLSRWQPRPPKHAHNTTAARQTVADIVAAGFPEPDIVLVDAGATIAGLEEEGHTYLFADAPTESTIWHEQGHKVAKQWFWSDLAPYFAVRGDIPDRVRGKAPYGEVFAEDFRLLFGCEAARLAPHRYRLEVGDLGVSLAPVVRKLLGFESKQARLRECVMSKRPAVSQEPLPPEQPKSDTPTAALDLDFTRKITANFALGEFACKCCGAVSISPRFADLVARLQAMRTLAGAPLHVTSGYRCANRDREVGTSGAPGFGPHTTGGAADIWIEGLTVDQTAELAGKAGFTGIGKYPNLRFVHVDMLGRTFTDERQA